MGSHREPYTPTVPSAPRVLCLCHDVTDRDVARAIAHGYRDLETVKRYTGALTGPCQGRSCQELVLAAVAAGLGVDVATLSPTTSRPPAFPVRMGDLAGGPPVDG
jgi:bacterioferritin-associated ferredoxin